MTSQLVAESPQGLGKSLKSLSNVLSLGKKQLLNLKTTFRKR